MSVLQKLLFAIGMRDEASPKLAKFQRSIDRTCRQARDSFANIGTGVMGMVGSGLAVHQMLSPAIDFNRAIGEVASLDVAGDALDHLQGQAKKFALDYGGNAAEVIRASYDIQSAIAGLQGKELGTFTVASATLAKGVKADTATITDYMGTMYGVWQDQADKMGKAQWVEKIAGQTATAVQMFKTNGRKWAEGISALGASATAKGIGAEEQFSVLGNLQMTMSGSESATKYNAFINGALGAQKKLGLSFFDKQGKMLGMVDILDKLKGKFGGKWDDKTMLAIKEAFGSDEAVKLIELLMGKTGKLREDMATLKKVQNMDKAKQMAAQMSDVWGRVGASVNVLAVTFGQKLLPSIEPVVDKLAGLIAYLVQCMDIAPDLTALIGKITVGFIMMPAVMGLLIAAFGVLKIAWLATTWPLKLMWGLLKGTTAALLRFTVALFANPVTWFVLGVAAALATVAIIIGELGNRWTAITTAFADGRWGDALMEILQALLKPIKMLGDGLGWIGEKLGLTAGAAQPDGPAGTLGKASRIGPTVDFMGHETEAATRIDPVDIPALNGPRTLDAAPGSVTSVFKYHLAAASGKTTTIGNVNFYPQEMMDRGELEELALTW